MQVWFCFSDQLPFLSCVYCFSVSNESTATIVQCKSSNIYSGANANCPNSEAFARHTTSH
ncbi:CQS_1a_G0045550.mRNA.1.CDS.1 [Saccharomyces cerevisiae]|nr:CQS_1a_G0045550.mRNA.1.CDS.1 [Saccharomyces cerevisiae]CAI7443781.1 CQS_1a_G0045550.mRNA.1.CDS.1 [Saccharomyces cerevisiae]